MLSENDLKLFKNSRIILTPKQVRNNNIDYVMRMVNEKIHSSRTTSIYFELENNSLKDDEILQIHNFFVDYGWRVNINNFDINEIKAISIDIEPALEDYI